MAVQTEKQFPMPSTQLRKKRTSRGGQNRIKKIVESDTSSSSDSASVDSNQSPQQSLPLQSTKQGKPNKRKNRNAKRKGNQARELTPEEKAQYVAMDCEMVGVGEGGVASALARVTLVGWEGTVLIDAYVKPDRQVTDFRSYVSGITPTHLENAEDLATCRARVHAILEGKVLVGHGLKNDMKALGLRHPWQMTRDTAKYEPFMKVRFNDGILWPRKLRDLVQEHLRREIQLPGLPHSPVEDAFAALDLYKAVRTKFEKVMMYKIQKTASIEGEKEQQVHTVR